MPRFEFIEGTSSKYWDIDLQGSTFTVRFGRIGTKGQEKTQVFASIAEAKTAYDKLIAEKVKKGYQPVEGEGSDAPPKPPAKVKAAPDAATLQVEAAVAENPGDQNTWRVLADAMTERGEKWGEVIAAALQGADQREAQEALVEKLFKTHAEFVTVTWSNGVMDAIEFIPEEEGGDDPHLALKRALQHPAGRLVRSLTLGLPYSDDTEWHMEGWAKALADSGPLPLLTTIDMSTDSEHMDQPSWRRVGDVHAVWKAAPRLRSLALNGAQGSDSGTPCQLEPIDGPHLERFVYQSGGLDESVPKALGAAKLPKLQHLELWFGDDNYGCTSTVDSCGEILNGRNHPALTSLGLKNSMFDEELLEALVHSTLLPKLQSLDLSMGIFAKGAAEMLVKHAKHFAHLQKLDLGDNYFSPADIAAIAKVLPKAEFGTQKEADGGDEEYRYPSVTE